MTAKRDALMTALRHALEAAPEHKRNALAQALEDYAQAYSRTVRGASPLTRELLSQVAYATDAYVEF